eukprot:SAG22_NODE_8269_length_669_cov_0.675439_1_plen_129_part_10
MPVFLCVQCYHPDCGMFQSIQKTKAGKRFSCKICREKQSILKVYAKSDYAKDIRQAVMALNAGRGERREEAQEEAASAAEHGGHGAGQEQYVAKPVLVSTAESKWSSYVPPDQLTAAESSDDDGEDLTT